MAGSLSLSERSFLKMKGCSKPMLKTIIIIYLIIINVITFIVYGADKKKAEKHKWRVKEATLFFLAAIGGSCGALIGMYNFHHKTKKWYFRFGIPAILIIQVLIAVLIIK